MKQAEAAFQASCSRCEAECPESLSKWRAACVRQQSETLTFHRPNARNCAPDLIILAEQLP